MAALDLFAEVRGHVVAQVVEAELGVRAVHDVARVGLVLLLERLHVLQHADADAERVVDRAHPFGVAAREVVVDGDQVHALAPRLLLPVARLVHGERVEHHRERRRQRLSLAGLHLGDLAVVQRHRTDHLHVEVAHAHLALAGLADDREALGQQRVERLAVARALAQDVHPLAQLGVAVVFELGLERVDQRDALLVGLVLLRLADVQRAIEQGGHAAKDSSRARDSHPPAALGAAAVAGAADQPKLKLTGSLLGPAQSASVTVSGPSVVTLSCALHLTLARLASIVTADDVRRRDVQRVVRRFARCGPPRLALAGVRDRRDLAAGERAGPVLGRRRRRIADAEALRAHVDLAQRRGAAGFAQRHAVDPVGVSGGGAVRGEVHRRVVDVCHVRRVAVRPFPSRGRRPPGRIRR